MILYDSQSDLQDSSTVIQKSPSGFQGSPTEKQDSFPFFQDSFPEFQDPLSRYQAQQPTNRRSRTESGQIVECIRASAQFHVRTMQCQLVPILSRHGLALQASRSCHRLASQASRSRHGLAPLSKLPRRTPMSEHARRVN